jgi:hypothetical protein
MTDDHFCEVGASGRIYPRSLVLDELERRHSSQHEDQWEVESFACRALDRHLFLVTYLLKQRRRVSRRSTIWRHEPGQWKAVYHQGTLVAEEG